MSHHFQNEVTRSPKSGKTQILSVLEIGQSQGSVTNSTGTQQGSSLGITKNVGNVIGEAFLYCHILGISAIDISAGSLEVRTQIFSTCQAELACPTGMVNPGYTDPISDAETVGSTTDCFDPADYLMTGNNRQMWRRCSALNLIKLSMTNTAS